ncbi:hypothetical protein BJ085DRAFT_12173, partial [Dimargaris cristalligena]
DITDAEQVQQACQGAALIINLVGIMHESPPRYTFDSVQHQGARNVAQGAWQAGARLVHVSAIGADPHSTIPYPRTKGLGELAVRDAHPKAVIFRPSIVFGKEDDFFNRFARLARFLPVMPVFGGGHTKFQPVYVNDLAAGLCRVAWTDEYSGKIIEAGGPRVYSYREIMELTLKESGLHRPIVSLPWSVSAAQAWVLEKLPPNLFTLTQDQVNLLKIDNVVNSHAMTLSDLGIPLTPAEAVLPIWM